MKIIIVGSNKVFSIEKTYVQYLKEFNVKVIHFRAQSIFYGYYQKSMLNKIIYRAGFSSVLQKINKRLLQIIENEKPDLIWIFKGMEIFPKTLSAIKAMGVKLVNFNPDNPFLFSGKGSGNKNITLSIPLYDLHLTYDRSIAAQFLSDYRISAKVLPFGFTVEEEEYEICRKEKEIIKACFLGNPDVHRAAFIRQLADAGITIDVYGHYWEKFLQHNNVTAFPFISETEYWKTLFKYRIQLNLMRPHNPDSHNMRSFEVPGVGGVMLAPVTTDHKEYFSDGKDVFLYTDKNHCAELLHYILNMTYSESQKVREFARKTSIEKKYHYRERTKTVLNFFEQLL